jgi:hypothetical protein
MLLPQLLLHVYLKEVVFNVVFSLCMEYKHSPNSNKVNSSDFPERKATHMLLLLLLLIHCSAFAKIR